MKSAEEWVKDYNEKALCGLCVVDWIAEIQKDAYVAGCDAVIDSLDDGVVVPDRLVNDILEKSR